MLGIFALLGGAAAGCGTSPTAPGNPQSQDQNSVMTTMAVEPSFTDDGVYQEPAMPPMTSARPAPQRFQAQTLITPLDYWRTFTHVSSSYSFAFSDTDSTGHPRWALVGIHRHLLGVFNILHSTATDTTHHDSLAVIQKPMDEMWERNLLFHRFGGDSAGSGPAWRLVGASAVRVTQHLAVTQILSVRVQSQNTGLDTTITDPSRLFLLRSVLRFTASDSITVTATTGNATDIVVLHKFDHRFRMHNNGDGSFTIGWHTGDWTGWRHFGVNAFSYGTLYDDTLPYDSQTWFIPYAITSDPVVDWSP